MKKIAFVGAPGSGKSTLAAQVFTTLKTKGYNADLVPEFVRQDINLHGPMQSIWEQYRIRTYQQELEDVIPSSVEYVICDSSTLTSYFYGCLYMNYDSPRERIVLQDMYRYWTNDVILKRYHAVFYVPVIDKVNLNDGTRFQNDEQVNVLANHMKMMFTQIFPMDNIYSLDGNFDSRLPKVLEILT